MTTPRPHDCPNTPAIQDDRLWGKRLVCIVCGWSAEIEGETTPLPEERRQAGYHHVRPLPTKCTNGHTYTKANTTIQSDGKRRCKTCAALNKPRRPLEAAQ